MSDAAVPRCPVMLVILDGFGVNITARNNAVAMAATPNFDRWFATNPHTLIATSGEAVGLPDGQMGNSEVGHMTMGSGTIVEQDMVLIDRKIQNGEFYQNPVLIEALERARENERPVHLSGLVSDGGVHSHLRHLIALIRLCANRGVRPVVHMITDGRDTPPRSALNYLPELEAELNNAEGCIATVIGRYYAMDRDKRWDRTQLAWRALILGEARPAQDPYAAIESAYAAGEDDEFIRPVRMPCAERIEDGDEFVFFNFRKDRPRQLLASLDCQSFEDFDRGDTARARVTCMMLYDHRFGMPYAFEHDTPKITLAEVLEEAGLKHFHCAETEKFAHVTYFFNGGNDHPMPHETRCLLPSPNVATYDLQPEMSAAEVADEVIRAVDSGEYAFIVVNFANGDMVGHTAVQEAVIRAVETLDREVNRILESAVEAGFSVVLTADHGNCEEMIDPVTGAPHTQHTTYPVPCMVVDRTKWRLSGSGGLANITPTVLQLMGLEIPTQMQPSLLLEAVQQDERDQQDEEQQESDSYKGAA